jgi:serine/threonine protein kinase
MKGIVVDFRRLLSFNSGLPGLAAYVIDFSGFEERTVLNEWNETLNEIHQRLEDGCLIVVKSMNVRDCIESRELENELKKVMNLHHPCITSPIGFVFPAKSSSLQELKIASLSTEGGSLAEILSVSPDWWTPTAKAKAVVGIVLGLRFAHSFGLIHSNLTTNNIFFDADHQVQITNFGLIGLEGRDGKTRCGIGGFLDEGWTPEVDIHAFMSLLFEIVVGHPATLPDNGTSERIVRSRTPELVLDIIDASRSDCASRCSLNSIISILKENHFQIIDGMDLEEVSAFVQWIEQCEESN